MKNHLTTNPPVNPNQLQEFATEYGIQPQYTDNSGTVHTISLDTLKSHLSEMGIPLSTETNQEDLARWRQQSWLRWLEPVQVTRHEDLPANITITLPQHLEHQMFNWTLVEESGVTHQHTFIPADLDAVETTQIEGITYRRYIFALPVLPKEGYHQFQISTMVDDSLQKVVMSFVVTPSRCFIPDSMKANGQFQRIWGPAVQLYAVRSNRNWGMGDFTDLRNLLSWCAREGANIVGVNPLHALFPINPQDASPYCPSSRLFLNIFYLDVEAIPDFMECEDARRLVFSESFQAKLQMLRDAEFVDYREVSAAKVPVLEKLYHSFRMNHLANNTPRAQEFHRFVKARGEKLYKFALFEALQERFHQDDPSIWGWPVWPEPYRDPNTQAVSEFAETNAERIGFYQYLQWQTHLQLQEVGALSWHLELTIGLYLDLAVGLSIGGADVWINQDLFAQNTGMGTPPDEFSPQGQKWGLPPFLPHKLKSLAYQPFIDLLRENMRFAGALRIDHFMALMRLFWVPNQSNATEGAYVNYPFEDLLGILALESHRSQTLIIGEDLGTVPQQVRDKMHEWDILSYKIFYFEKTENGEFAPPGQYPQKALAALSSQDLPTLKGFWYGHANTVRNELGLISSETFAERQVKDLLMDRMHLLAALDREKLLPEGVTTDPATVPHLTPEFYQAVHLYLARTPCMIQVIQFEDILEQLEQVNMPGTTTEYPNWCRKLSVSLEDFPTDSRVTEMFALLRKERHNPRPETVGLKNEEAVKRLLAKIPGCTYRFQFNRHFTFKDATRLIPYLYQLGVSHCYASPLLEARPGSTHGYDIINHGRLNPEIGSEEDFIHFTDTLRAHQMSLIVDVVPNHMGIGSDNAWWLDVLENGPASEYANYFDIDWSPLKDELFGKVLLPVLGRQYGQALANEEIQVRFNRNTARLTLHYYDHTWPVSPNSYPMVLKHRLEILAARIGEDDISFLRYQSIIDAFEHLPQYMLLSPEQVSLRQRERSVTFQRLQELCHNIPQIADFIEENLADFNQVKDNLINRQRLHNLLEAQAYRLAYWRVASDEINYRRFFDINDLAGLNTQIPRVFWDTHHFILQYIKEGRIAGLRVDHPDGLYDPAGYFRQLQEEALKAKAPPGLTFDLSPQQLPLYIVAEKILASYERLPETWLVHGTTGYEFANQLTGLFIDRANEHALTSVYGEFTGLKTSIQDLVYSCKKLIMRDSLASELNVLAYQLNRISEKNWSTRDYTLNNLRHALSEVVACFPVYRTYVTPGQVSKKDEEYIDWAVQVAKKRSPLLEPSIFDFIRDILLLRFEVEDEDSAQAITHFAMRFQQFTGPVMAKGLEDTCFYRYNRLIALNEVGGEPQHFGNTVLAFHHQNLDRLRSLPHTMLNTSTHDSKRSEDVRARICVLSEMPDVWKKHLHRWTRLNRSKKSKIDGQPIPDPNDEYLIYQTLLGVWPFQHDLNKLNLDELVPRLTAYFLKAAREAKVHTSWINQNAEYETALTRFIQGILSLDEQNPFLDDFLPLQRKIAFWGMLNALAQTVLKFMVPGMPDIYQGNDLWDFSLVDPDNRRPIDYALREEYLKTLAPWISRDTPSSQEQHLALARALLDHYHDGRIKLYVTATCLHLRRQYPDLFEKGSYVPLDVTGDYAEHVVAFARHLDDMRVVVVVPRLPYKLTKHQTRLPVGKTVWKDTWLNLDLEFKRLALQNCLTHELVDIRDKMIPLSELLKSFPVGLFVEAL